MIQRFIKKSKCTEDVALRNALYILFRVEGMTVEQASAARDRIAPRVPGSVLEIRERDE
jgi:hypothetical protein